MRPLKSFCLLSCCLLTVVSSNSLDAVVEGLGDFVRMVADTPLNQHGVMKLIQKADTVFGTKDLSPALNVSLDVWWGDVDFRYVDESIRDFEVDFSDEMIADLKHRLFYRRTFKKSLQHSGHTYGINSALMVRLVNHWANNYDFEAREQQLNRFPQYITKVQGLDIHYIHIKPNTTKPIVPILLLHGSPFTAFENSHLIEELSILDKDFVFEIVAPDLPGFGYSEGPFRPGLNGYQIGIMMKYLMERLGHQKFYIHCSDVGTWPGNAMAVLFPHQVLGLHTNFALSLSTLTLVKYGLGAFAPSAVIEPQYEHLMYPLSKHLKELLENNAYVLQYATRPDNIAIGLDQSPIALASWLVPMMITGGEGGAKNNLVDDGMLFENFQIDDILDSLTIYWDTQCILSAARLYAEEFAIVQDPNTYLIQMSHVKVPTAVIKLKNDLVYMSDALLHDRYRNLVQSTLHAHGGHYSALSSSVHRVAASIWSAVPKMQKFNAENNLNSTSNLGNKS